MKKLLPLIFLIPSLVSANTENSDLQIATFKTVCINSKDLAGTIDDFKEIPFVRGVSTPIMEGAGASVLVIFANPTTGTFTIVERTGEDLYCVLAIGSSFEPVPKQIQDDVRKNQNKGSL
jgi:hypothetical protein